MNWLQESAWTCFLHFSLSVTAVQAHTCGCKITDKSSGDRVHAAQPVTTAACVTSAMEELRPLQEKKPIWRTECRVNEAETAAVHPSIHPSIHPSMTSCDYSFKRVSAKSSSFMWVQEVLSVTFSSVTAHTQNFILGFKHWDERNNLKMSTFLIFTDKLTNHLITKKERNKQRKRKQHLDRKISLHI